MRMEDYKSKCKELQERVNKTFEEIKVLATPDLANTDWFINQIEKLADSLGQLHLIQSEYRRLQAEQYELVVPEDQPEQIPNFDPSKYQKEEPEVQSDPAAEIATAMAGVGALISLFRKARR